MFVTLRLAELPNFANFSDAGPLRKASLVDVPEDLSGGYQWRAWQSLHSSLGPRVAIVTHACASPGRVLGATYTQDAALGPANDANHAQNQWSTHETCGPRWSTHETCVLHTKNVYCTFCTTHHKINTFVFRVDRSGVHTKRVYRQWSTHETCVLHFFKSRQCGFHLCPSQEMWISSTRRSESGDR